MATQGVSVMSSVGFVKFHCEGVREGANFAELAEAANMSIGGYTQKFKKMVDSGRYIGLDKFVPKQNKRGRKPVTESEVDEANALIAALLAE